MRGFVFAPRDGAVLLEVLIALAVLGSAIGGTAWLAAEAMRSVNHTYAAEAAVRDAHRLLSHVALWPRRDLDLRLGQTRQGQWWLRVDRVHPMLYDVTITDVETGAAILRTTIFRAVER